jgi:hypothetical protein
MMFNYIAIFVFALPTFPLSKNTQDRVDVQVGENYRRCTSGSAHYHLKHVFYDEQKYSRFFRMQFSLSLSLALTRSAVGKTITLQRRIFFERNENFTMREVVREWKMLGNFEKKLNFRVRKAKRESERARSEDGSRLVM